jgi:hypothetical protein
MIQHHYTIGTSGGSVNTSCLCGALAFGSQATDTPLAVPGSITNWNLRMSTVAGAAKSRTMTIQKNLAATALAITIGGATDTYGTDTSSVSFAAGDTILLTQSNVGAPVASMIQSDWEFLPDDGVSCVIGWGSHSVALTTIYTGPRMRSGTSTTESVASAILGVAGTITGQYLKVNTAPSSTHSRTWTIMLNGVAQDGTGGTPDTRVTITGAATTGNTTGFALAVAATDTISIRHTVSGTPTSATGATGSFAFVPSAAGGPSPVFGTVVVANASYTNYECPGTVVDVARNATETAVELIGGINPVNLYSMYVSLTAAPGGSNSRAFTLRKNGADTGHVVTITGAGTNGISTAAAETITASDTWTVKEVTAAGTAATAKIAFFVKAAPLVGSPPFSALWRP